MTKQGELILAFTTTFFLSENASDGEIIVEQANYAFLNYEKIAKKWTIIALH